VPFHVLRTPTITWQCRPQKCCLCLVVCLTPPFLVAHVLQRCFTAKWPPACQALMPLTTECSYLSVLLFYRVLLPLCVIVLQSALTSLCYCFTECSYLSVLLFYRVLLPLCYCFTECSYLSVLLFYRVLLPLCVIVLQSALTSLCYCFTECSYLSVIAFNSKLLTLPASMLCSCRPYSEIHPNGLRAKGQFREFRDQIVQRSFQIVQISVQIVQKSFLIDYVPKVSSDTWNSRPKRAWRAL